MSFLFKVILITTSFRFKKKQRKKRKRRAEKPAKSNGYLIEFRSSYRFDWSILFTCAILLVYPLQLHKVRENISGECNELKQRLGVRNEKKNRILVIAESSFGKLRRTKFGEFLFDFAAFVFFLGFGFIVFE